MTDAIKTIAQKLVYSWAIDRFDSENVISPCLSVCVIDEARGLCSGCLRTLDEIAGWSSMSSDERRAVWRAIDTRAATRGPDDAAAGGSAP